jgi:hypothetical protein
VVRLEPRQQTALMKAVTAWKRRENRTGGKILHTDRTACTQHWVIRSSKRAGCQCIDRVGRGSTVGMTTPAGLRIPHVGIQSIRSVITGFNVFVIEIDHKDPHTNKTRSVLRRPLRG